MIETILVIVALIVGGGLGFVITRFIVNSNAKDAIANAEHTLKDAEKQAETLKREALV
jgi:ribonuclease Y